MRRQELELHQGPDIRQHMSEHYVWKRTQTLREARSDSISATCIVSSDAIVPEKSEFGSEFILIVW